MSYVSENLMKDEKLIYEGKTHWGTFISLKSLFTLGILPLLEINTNSFGITDKRIIMKAGILSVNLLENNISRIDNIKIEKPLLGRILGYGTIVVGTAGNSDGFNFVSNPDEFKKKFNEVAL